VEAAEVVAGAVEAAVAEEAELRVEAAVAPAAAALLVVAGAAEPEAAVVRHLLARPVEVEAEDLAAAT
jgi:hypothetical protein